eukprot:24704-Eustigmatos_ZCMA.PRE.1
MYNMIVGELVAAGEVYMFWAQLDRIADGCAQDLSATPPRACYKLVQWFIQQPMVAGHALIVK